MAKPVTFRFLADASKMRKELSQAEKDLRRIGSSMQNVGRNMTAGLTLPLVALGASSIDAASDLEQSLGAIESVFGDSSRTIEDFGDTAAQSFGLSRREVNETAAVLGAQLKSMGFSADDAADQVIGLQQRAADMAATFGGTTREALEAIASLMRGERDPIERYGVAIKQADINARLAADGLDDLEGEAAKQAEAQAALSTLFEQTADSAGQFASESDTLAGQLARSRAEFENTRAEIGERLLPVASELLSFGNDALQTFGKLPDNMQDLVVRIGAVAAAAGPLIYAGGTVVKNFERMRDVLGSQTAGLIGKMFLAATAATVLEDAIESMTGLGATDLSNLSREVDRFIETGNQQGIDQLVGGFDGIAASLDEIADPSVYQSIEGGFNRILDAIPGVLDTSFSQQVRDLEALDQILANLVQSGRGDAAAEIMSRINDAAEKQGVSLETLNNVLPNYVREVEIAGSTALDTERSTDDLSGAVDGLGDSTQDTRTDVQRLDDALRGLIGVNLSAEAAASRYEGAIDDLAGSLKENGVELDLNSEKGRENRQAIRDVIESTLNHAEALAEQGVPLADINRLLDTNRQELEEVLRAAGLTEDEVQDLIDTYGLIPGQITTELNLDTAQARAELAELDRIAGNVAIPGTVAGGRTAGNRAVGGPVTAGNTYLVGENGPELFTAQSSGNITPMGSGGGRTATASSPTINFNGPVYGSKDDLRRQIQEAIREYERRNGRTGF